MGICDELKKIGMQELILLQKKILKKALQGKDTKALERAFKERAAKLGISGR